MSNYHGCGVIRYGWRHAPDGTATATNWISVLWLPVIPIYRERLRVLTNFENDQENTEAVFGGIILEQVDRNQVLERQPLNSKGVGITLLKVYIGLPAYLVVPNLIIALLFKTLFYHKGMNLKPGSPAYMALMVPAVLIFLNFIWQIVRAIRRSRGQREKAD